MYITPSHPIKMFSIGKFVPFPLWQYDRNTNKMTVPNPQYVVKGTRSLFLSPRAPVQRKVKNKKKRFNSKKNIK